MRLHYYLLKLIDKFFPKLFDKFMGEYREVLSARTKRLKRKYGVE